MLRPWFTPRVSADHFVGIPGRVHHNDELLDTRSSNSIANYRQAGLEAYQLIEHALNAAGRSWPSVQTVLDYGCGYGRVTRWIAGKQPGVQLVAADVDAAAAQFCGIEFHALPYVVDRDSTRLRFATSFDLVWAGAVLTHLNENDGRELIRALIDALAPDGLLLFTTNGELIPDRVRRFGHAVAASTNEIKATLVHGGIAFLPGNAVSGPVTFHARAAIRAQLADMACELVSLERRGWDNHQDVWVVKKRAL